LNTDYGTFEQQHPHAITILHGCNEPLVRVIRKEKSIMRRIAMEKAKEILWLSLKMGLSQREVASGTGCSLGMVNTILSRVKEAGIADPLSFETKELGSIIYPPEQGRDKADPDFTYIDREIKKKGVTLFLLWEEYKVLHPEGCMYSQFCAKYRKYRKQNSVYLRKVYKAGDQMSCPQDTRGLGRSYNEV
jgi:hypothetical protein